MNKRKTCFVTIRLQQDWNQFYDEKFCLDGFAIKISLPIQAAKCCYVTLYVSAPITIYNDKSYQVLHPLSNDSLHYCSGKSTLMCHH